MAVVSTTLVKSILDTLPVGFYLGSRAKVSYSETSPTSYCSPMDGTIVVALSNVVNAMSEVEVPDNDPVKTEEFVRGCLYHEVSHLILTPRGLTNTNWFNIAEDERIETRLRSYYRDVNFRELLLKMNHWTSSWEPADAEGFFFGIMRYHMGPADLVKKGAELLKKYINLTSGTDRYGANDYYYDMYYFWKECCERFEEEEAKKAASSKADSSESENGDKGAGNGSSSSGSSSNEDEKSMPGEEGNEDEDNGAGNGKAPKDEADEEEGEGKSGAGDEDDEDDEKGNEPEDGGKDGEEDADEPESEKGEGEDEDAGDAGDGEAEDGDKGEDEDGSLDGTTPDKMEGGDGTSTNDVDTGAEAVAGEEGESEIKEAAEEMDEDVSEIPVLGMDEVAAIVGEIMNEFNDPATSAALHRTIIRACKRKANKSGCSCGYAGHIDPRAVGIRKDYRWFTKKGDNGGKYDRVHLTLWVDNSGSFCYAVKNVNKLIASLTEVEKLMPGDFSFDVVTMNYRNVEHDKREPIIATGGNKFGPGIPALHKKLHKAGWTNYDVVVWDGDLASDLRGRYEEKVNKYIDAYRCFDNNKTIIVTDETNERYLQKGCPGARITYVTGNYSENFVKEVLALLDRML